jgi:hypothetical protein
MSEGVSNPGGRNAKGAGVASGAVAGPRRPGLRRLALSPGVAEVKDWVKKSSGSGAESDSCKAARKSASAAAS